MEKTKMTSQKLILILASLGTVLFLLAIIGLIKFGTIFFFVPFWFWTVDKIVELTGANIWLARGFAALFVLPFFYLIKLIFSWKAERRLVGWILFSLLTASLCFTMFFLSEDIYFSFKTGQAEKWYIVTPAGEYQFSASPGFNTFWGIEYQPVTPEVMKKYIEREQEEKTIENEKKETPPVVPDAQEKKVEEAIPEKEITTRPTIPEEVIFEKTTSKKLTPPETVEEKISRKEIVTQQTTPKEAISEKIPEKEASREVTPERIVSTETKNSPLSQEEERLLGEEIKKYVYPESEEEVKKLFDILERLEESRTFPKHHDLLCFIMTKNLNHKTFGPLISEGMICYLAKIGSMKSSLPLKQAFDSTNYSPEKRLINEVVVIIGDGEKIDLKSPPWDKYAHPFNKERRGQANSTPPTSR